MADWARNSNIEKGWIESDWVENLYRRRIPDSRFNKRLVDCPFCGYRDTAILHLEQMCFDGVYKIYAKCVRCNARGPCSTTHFESDIDASTHNTINDWNKSSVMESEETEREDMEVCEPGR